MKNKITLLIAVAFALLGFTQQLNAQVTTRVGALPIHSTETTPRWIFIQHQQNGGVLELSETGTAINTKARLLATGNDRQLWRFEKVGENQYKIFNKGRAGSFVITTSTATWDESLTATSAPVFTIAFGTITNTKYTIKATNNYFLQSTSQTADLGLAASESASPYWIFVAAPGGSTDANPVWYEMKSERPNNDTYLVDDAGTVKHVSTSDFSNDAQLWRLEQATNGYKLINKASGNAMLFSGSISTANNVTTADVTTADEFVFSPDYAAKGHLGLYKQGTTYYAFDYYSNGTCGLFSKTGLGTNQYFTLISQLSAPAISPNGATNITEATQQVTITSSANVADEKIYYTTDGTDPDATSTEYTEPFDVIHNTTVKAISIAVGYAASDIATSEFSFQAISWIGNSFVTIGGSESGTWYKASNTDASFNQFDGADIGDFSESILAGGEAQVYPKTAQGVSMGYMIDGGTPNYITLPKTDEIGNNSKHYAEESVDISELSVGEHTIAVWFKAERDETTIWDSNNSNNFVANFTKISTGISNITDNNYAVCINDGVITVKGIDNFEVYSITGQKQNHNSPLQKGAYIVKVKNSSQKVVIR